MCFGREVSVLGPVCEQDRFQNLILRTVRIPGLIHLDPFTSGSPVDDIASKLTRARILACLEVYLPQQCLLRRLRSAGVLRAIKLSFALLLEPLEPVHIGP